MKRAYLYILISVLSTDLLFGAILTGRTEGSFSVSSSGAASYSIPITIQKGLSDFIPNISLSYNSQVGNGIAGLGWIVSGLSSISIAPRNPYFDGHSEAIYKGEDNVFVLDGMRLLLTSGTNGMTGATYRTESEQYSIIRITDSSNGTPQTFQVRASDGSTYRYGSTTGRYQTPDGETYGWALDYAEDALGNFISYNYSQEGILYPTSISYGHNVHGTNGVDCTITFNYESRPDSISSYLFGFQTYFKKRLKNIVCKYNGNTYRTYTLNYTEDTYSRLASVTEAGTSTSTLRPTTFEWNVPQFQVNCGSRSMETALLENMDDETAESIVGMMDQESGEDIKLIRSYEDDEIGSRMTTNYIVIHDSLTVKEAFDNPQIKKIIQDAAPNLGKYPIKLFNKKTCGEIFDLVVSKKIVPEDVARQIEARINAL